MTNEISPSNPAQTRFADFTRKQNNVKSPSLPVRWGAQSGLATTFTIARTDGGVGASILALMLEYFYGKRVFIIQVGGLKSWAYAKREESDFLHIKPHEDEDRFSPPIDARIRQPERVAIIEFEHAMAREAIKAASLITHSFEAHAPLCLIASAHDPQFSLPDLARREGLEPVTFRQASAAPVCDEEILKIPTVPRALAVTLRTRPDEFAELPDAWFSPVAALTFKENLEAFKKRISEKIS